MTDSATATRDAASTMDAPGLTEQLDTAIRRYGLHVALVDHRGRWPVHMREQAGMRHQGAGGGLAHRLGQGDQALQDGIRPDAADAPPGRMIALAGDAAIEAVEQCAERGVRAAVVMTSGFGETDPVAGKAKEKLGWTPEITERLRGELARYP